MEMVLRQQFFWQKVYFSAGKLPPTLFLWSVRKGFFFFFLQKTFSLLSFLNLKTTPSLFQLIIRCMFLQWVSLRGPSKRAQHTDVNYSVGWAAIKKTLRGTAHHCTEGNLEKKLNQSHWGKLLLLPLASWGLYFPLSPAMSSVSEVSLKRSEHRNSVIGILSVQG